MTDNIKCLDDLFNKVELYNDLKFIIFQKKEDHYVLDDNVIRQVVNILGCRQKTITSLCKWCNKEYPFEIKGHTDFLNGTTPMSLGKYVVFFAPNLYVGLENGVLNGKKSVFQKDDLYNDVDVSYYEYVFTCTKHDNHKYKMILLIRRELDTITITKIGQYPSMIDVWGFDFDKYKKQLEKNKAYDDFKKAELCYADGFVAGAYTYLRRVFEKMLDKYCEGVSLKDNHTETKIKACKDKFDERIHGMLNNLYKILSKGIHQLADEETRLYYQYLRAVIVMQLEHIKEQNDKEAQSQELSKVISDIASKLN